VDTYLKAHFTEVVEQFTSKAEAATAAVLGKAAELCRALDAYQAVYGRSVALTAPVRGIDGRHVPGIDQAAELRRAVESINLPVPIPGDRRVA
jgi:hypothetical protein